jgi:agmatinase
MSLVNRPYVGIPTFLRAPHRKVIAPGEADVAVLGVPFDEGSPFLPGSRMGPRAIREHSLRFPSSGCVHDTNTDIEYLAREFAEGRIVDVGDVDIRPTNVEATFEEITREVRAILDAGAMPVVLGGDHSITYPIVRAYDRPIHVLQFDAHLDYSPFENGLRYTNGHAFRHIAAMETTLSVTQVGIRGLRNSRGLIEEIRAKGNRVVTMAQARDLGADGIAGLIPAGAAVYVTIDIDAYDLSLVPGCVSGEPDGFLYAELVAALRAVAARHEVVGFDLVEVNPPLDVGTGATAYLGATTAVLFLGEICRQPYFAARSRS